MKSRLKKRESLLAKLHRKFGDVIYSEIEICGYDKRKQIERAKAEYRVATLSNE